MADLADWRYRWKRETKPPREMFLARKRDVVRDLSRIFSAWRRYIRKRLRPLNG